MKTVMFVILAAWAPVIMADAQYKSGPDACPICHMYTHNCEAIKKLHDLWWNQGGSKPKANILYKECRVEGKPGNPERTDPNYLAWKDLRNEYVLMEDFIQATRIFRDRFPGMEEQYKVVRENCSPGTSDYVSQWAKYHLAPRYEALTDKYRITSGDPPPECFGTDHVDKQGRSVDKYGDLDPSGGGDKDFFKYLIVPFVLAVVVALYFKSKGSENGPFLGVVSIFVYAWLTDPWMVAGYFLGAYMLVGLFVILCVKTLIAAFKK